MKGRAIKILNYIVFPLLGILLLYLSFREVKLSSLLEALREVNYWWVGVSVITGILICVIRAARWGILIEPLGFRIPLRNLYNAVMVGYLVNFVVPRLGEVSRCVSLRKTDKLPFESAIGTVVVERVVDMLCLLICIVIVILARINFFGDFLYREVYMPISDQMIRTFNTSWLGWVIVGGLLIFSVVLLFVFRKKLMEFSPVKKVVKLLIGLLNGLKTGFKLKHRRRFLFQTLLIWFGYWFTSYSIIQAIPSVAGLTWLDALFLMVLGAIGWAVPVPGGFGAYHFIVSSGILMYNTIGYSIEKDQAMAFATISHESQAIFMIVLGLIALLYVFYQQKRAEHLT